MGRSTWAPGRPRCRAETGWLPGLALLAVGCVGSATTADDAATLAFTPTVDAVACDGTGRPAGRIEGAEPGEIIGFTSALPIDIDDAEADADGRYALTWTCEPPEARLRWDITAVGTVSGRSVSFTIKGAEFEPDGSGLAVTLDGEEVVCDGIRHDVGTLSGAQTDEAITFDSDQTSGLHSGRADETGELVVGWTCRPGDIGRTWEVTATATASGRTGSFTLLGTAPDTTPTVEVEVFEDPFVCDGTTREFAVLSNFVPEEPVTFDAPGVDDLRDGRAGPDGSLPLNWQCGAGGDGTTWQLTATGVESGRKTTITFTGAADPTGPGQPVERVASLSEDPFVCDSQRRPVATLTNLLPGEFVDFTSPQAENLREGRADAAGRLTVNWQCDREDLEPDGSTTWDLTATGRESRLTVKVQITGTDP